jgi:hypothetical protein
MAAGGGDDEHCSLAPAKRVTINAAAFFLDGDLDGLERS